jgi:hypothetical protein
MIGLRGLQRGLQSAKQSRRNSSFWDLLTQERFADSNQWRNHRFNLDCAIERTGRHEQAASLD